MDDALLCPIRCIHLHILIRQIGCPHCFLCLSPPPIYYHADILFLYYLHSIFIFAGSNTVSYNRNIIKIDGNFIFSYINSCTTYGCYYPSPVCILSKKCCLYSREFATVIAAFFASICFLAPFTFISKNFVAPSPSLTIICASFKQTLSSILRKVL